MIEINLLPSELRVREKIAAPYSRNAAYLILIFAGIILCLHLYYAFLGIILGSRKMLMSNKWNQMQGQRSALDNFKKQNAAVSSDSKALLDLLHKRIRWSQKLNSLALDLPYGIWLRDLNASPRELVLQGSAISLQKEELTLINKFISNLKDDTQFFGDFANIELKSVQTKNAGIYDIVEFSLSAPVQKK